MIKGRRSARERGECEVQKEGERGRGLEGEGGEEGEGR